jgi:glycerol-3-phosphate dehydrogenase (NAD(P)+)
MTSRGGAAAVIGAGTWGTALAVQLGRSGMAVRLWARDPAMARALGGTRENRRYLPDIPLPESVVATADHLEALAGSDP